MKKKMLLFNFISPILVKLRYRNKKDPFYEFSKIIKGNTFNHEISDNGIILITPIRISPVSNLFEGLIGKFYQLKGEEVKVLMCNQSVEYCENFTKFHNKNIACALCKKEQQRFSKFFKLNAIKANECVSLDEIKDIKKLINERNFNRKEDFYFDDIDFYNAITSAVMRHTLKSEIYGNIYLLKKYAFTAFFYSRVISNLNKNLKIKTLISSHGIYSTWGSIIDTCKKLNIYSIVWGRGYIGQGNLLFGNNNSYHEEFIYEKPIYNKEDKVTEVENEVLSYYKKKMEPDSKVDFINYYKDLQQNNDKEGMDLSEIAKLYKIVFGMYTNIPWDGEMLKPTENFPTTRIFVKSVIEWFDKNPECLLIIRAHPAEVSREEGKGTETFQDLLLSEFKILPKNVIFIKPDSSITSYFVSNIADANILFGSTMSLELAIQKKVVIQGGKNEVSFKNIVYDAHDKVTLYKYLDKVKSKELCVTDEMYNNALKYGYYWIKKRHIKDTSVVLDKLLFQEYTFDNTEEFLNDEMLNFVTKKISNKERIIYD
ncbi:MAG: hypothetical protein PHN58_08100 [Candidatus Cloacimonetes bacterium]|nr:hypothetical protein [Candidatus Cloacimonadota bacterium]